MFRAAATLPACLGDGYTAHIQRKMQTRIDRIFVEAEEQ